MQGGAGLLPGLCLSRSQIGVVIFPDFDAAVRGVPVELGDAAQQMAVASAPSPARCRSGRWQGAPTAWGIWAAPRAGRWRR